MTDWLNEWVQEGRLYIWRYADPKRGWAGWHLTADPLGCRSVRDLLDRMHAGEPRHRTLRLDRVTDVISSLSGYSQPAAGHFSRLRLDYRPEFPKLHLSEDEDRLTMTLGDRFLPDLSSALARVEVGEGDFAVRTSDAKKADIWMFW